MKPFAHDPTRPDRNPRSADSLVRECRAVRCYARTKLSALRDMRQTRPRRVRARLLAAVSFGAVLVLLGSWCASAQVTYQTVFSFQQGMYPNSKLIEGSDGALYGTTRSGTGTGTAFKLNKDGSGFEVLHEFSGTPIGGLVEAQDGALYGTTEWDGANCPDGTVFTLHKDGNCYAVLHKFVGDDGAAPQRLVAGTDGALYGTTGWGGTNGGGVVFKVNRDGCGFSVLLDAPVCGADLTEGSDGVLYAARQYSGTVFKLNRDGSGYTVLQNGLTGDRFPNPGLLFEGSDGALYGTTLGGVFKLSKDGSGYSVLADVHDPSGLIEGSDGFLYGTTASFGRDREGVLFKLNKDGSGFVVLHIFFRSLGGLPPFISEPVEASDGALYGIIGSGSVFRLQPAPEVFLQLTPEGPSVRFAGQRGRTYEIECASAVTGPWETIATRLAPPDNVIECIDATPSSSAAFYRVRRVP